MKISLAIGALAALGTTADAWYCNIKGGGLGHGVLKSLHKHFNEKYGGAALTIAPSQIYWIECNGNVFGVGSTYGETYKEPSNYRNLAAASNPGNGGRCLFETSSPRIRYYFGRKKDFSFVGAGNSIRHC
ncbi:hypothetical protein FQN57_001307 [Myotisia sp. PD_48]|nr:hypothetical protein FQN57_001307 [Myotisia sp. PD_48]